MARPDWSQAHAVALSDALAKEPYRFGFFNAVRYLERCFPETPRIGASIRLSDDPIRLGQEPSLAFAPATLASFSPANGQDTDEPSAPRLEVYFMGLLGPNGPLPIHLTEYARDRMRAKDNTLDRFLDVFHHRILSLFYRAWAAAQPVVHYDRPSSDRFAYYVGSTFGLGMDSVRNRDAAPDRTKLFFSGHMSNQSNHPQGLRDILAEFFQTTAEVQEFIGQWLDLPATYHCRMGESPDTGSLGLSVTVGSRIWDCQQKFRIVLGPVDYAMFQKMIPGGKSLDRLIALVRNYCGDQMDWELNVILRKEDVPSMQLGQQGQLGWTSWVNSKTPDKDAADLLLNPMASVL